jgi:predicted permease
MALVLLVGSGLMVRSFVALRSVDPGFDPAGTLTARIIVPTGEIADPQETESFFRLLRERLSAQPGVEAVGFVSGVPLGRRGIEFGGLSVEDHPRGPDELPIFASMPRADAGYVEAMGIRVLEGRSFRSGDGGDEGRGALVSESFARAWWPGSSALGRRVAYDGADEDTWHTIVGVVEDVHQYGLEEPPRETVYFPGLGGSASDAYVVRARDVVVRVAGDPLSFLPVLRREMRALNPRIPLATPRTLVDVVEEATARTSFTLTLLGAASAVALLLGLVGIYGVISYVVSQRTREIGVRLALGASAPAVRGMVVRQGMVLTTWGLILGLLAAGGLSKVMASLLFGVRATDPATYASVAAALALVSLAASWLPARRAAAVDPGTALRVE